MMKTKKILATAMVCGALISSNAMATTGGKIPPGQSKAFTSTWFQSVINFFDFSSL